MEYTFREFVSYWSTVHDRIRGLGLGLGLGLGIVSMHVVSPWNIPFVTFSPIWLVAGFSLARSHSITSEKSNC